VDADGVLAALARYVLAPGDRVVSVQPSDGGLHVRTDFSSYAVQPADWRVASLPWVSSAVRIVEDPMILGSPVFVHGLLVDGQDQVWHANNPAALRRLGQLLGPDLPAPAYAELLAEFLSGRDIDAAVVIAPAPGRSGRAGWLADGPDLAARFPGLDPALLTPPALHQDGPDLTLEFVSVHQVPGTIPPAVDVLAWNVYCGPGRDATWTRKYLAMQIETA
jgi:hypothetical protein